MMVLDKWASCSLFIGLLAQDCRRQQQIENKPRNCPCLAFLAWQDIYLFLHLISFMYDGMKKIRTVSFMNHDPQSITPMYGPEVEVGWYWTSLNKAFLPSGSTPYRFFKIPKTLLKSLPISKRFPRIHLGIFLNI